MLAVGEHTIGPLDQRTIKMTTGFSGGIGVTYRDLCGAFSAGIMIIGALHGRTQPDEEDDFCLKMATDYRDRFAQELGSIYCRELRVEKYGAQGEEPCWVLVERAAGVLLAILNQRENKK